jgi:hypothetical protein
MCLIAMWNIYSVHRMLESKSYIEQYIEQYKINLDANESIEEHEEPPENTNALGNITWYAFGDAGLQFVDSILIMLMMGIIIAYEGV